MKCVVFGYHNIGCVGIKSLLKAGFEISAIFTHEDNPGENVWFDSVAELACEENIPVYAPEDVNHPIWVKRITEMQPDVAFSFYYRNMLKPAILDIPRLGCFNLHGSLLPKYRGRVPINWVLLNGETETGVTIALTTKVSGESFITEPGPLSEAVARVVEAAGTGAPQEDTGFADAITAAGGDFEPSLVARLGGDEFTVAIPNLPCVEDALILAHRIRETMRHPFQLESRDVVLTASVGIALYPVDGEDVETLVKHADTAMYHAKSEGRDNCQFYSEALTEQAEKRLTLENDLRNAMLQNELQLVYQPLFNVASNSIRSVEALIRWQHPKQGLISPLEFIPLAEENGLIIPIGDWVLRAACNEAVQWHKNGRFLQVAVNLSPIQFTNPDLVKNVLNILAETNFPPNKLTLEITEGALMNYSADTLETLKTLRDHKIRIALDDFGTGYSSMSYLKQLPIHTIKVDQIFIRSMLDDKDSLSIVRAIISLSKNLGFSLTAEGIETLEQAKILKYLGCETLQGYYFSKPINGSEILTFCEKQWSIQAVESLEI